MAQVYCIEVYDKQLDDYVHESYCEDQEQAISEAKDLSRELGDEAVRVVPGDTETLTTSSADCIAYFGNMFH